MATMNQLEQQLRATRGDQWVEGAKTQALAYQEFLRGEAQKDKMGSFYLTSKGTKVRVRKMQLQVLKDQKRRVNNQPYPIDEKRWILKGLDLAMQALQNVQNPNNQW